jgi:GTP-binding protein EngB required for normal cell division
LAILDTTIENSVLATKQTYVDALKKNNNFDETAKKMAFKITYDAVMASLTEETKNNLAIVINDLPKYITDLIEAKVQLIK